MIELFDGVSFICDLGDGLTDTKIRASKKAAETLSRHISANVQMHDGTYVLDISAFGFNDNWRRSDYDNVAYTLCDIMNIDSVDIHPQKASGLFSDKHMASNEKSYTYRRKDMTPEINITNEPATDPYDDSVYEKDRETRLKRRKNDKKHQNRSKALAEALKYHPGGKWHTFGPWFSEDKGRVINHDRGKLSKKIKKKCNKKVRKTPLAPKGNRHKKASEYKGELI